MIGIARKLRGVFRDRSNSVVFSAGEETEHQLKRQLQQMYKMEAVGQLAGGIAHDFNNLLTVIAGYSSLALNELTEQDGDARRHIGEVQRAAEQAADLTRQLLAYSRQQVLEPTSLDLNRIVQNSEMLLRRVIGEDIVIVDELGDDLGLVLADEGQLPQVLMCLAVNARDAMPRGGRLTLRTRNARLEDSPEAQVLAAPPGEYVVLEVADTGTGMDEETKARIFEPFFTTKPAGQGTGLGLATVFGIVKQSEGYIEVDSAIGAGTTFTIYLPRNDTLAPGKSRLSAASTYGGEETILLVEDEPTLRTLIEKMLEVRGYTVLTASDAEEALQLNRENAVDAVVTDVVMPGVNGPELVDELRRQRPRLRALYTSGYTADAVLPRAGGEPEVAFVQKPFSAEELASRLRELLDG